MKEPDWWFPNGIAGERSTLSPAGLSGDSGNPAKGAGGGVGFGYLGRDFGEDGRRSRRLQDNSRGVRVSGASHRAGDGDGVAAAFVDGGEDDVDFIDGGVAGG